MTITTWDDLPSFSPFAGLEAAPIWLDGVMAARVKPAPGARASVHAHPHRQLGVVLEGSLHLRIGDEEGEVGPGGVYAVASGVEHEARAGDRGCVLIDVFGPEREDWVAKVEGRA